MRRWLSVLITMATAASGCAGGAWLETPAEELTAHVAQPRGYPTAIRPVAAQQAVAADSGQPPAQTPPAPAVPLDAQQPPVAPEVHNRIEQPKLPAPTLAVVPPHLRRYTPLSTSPINPLIPLADPLALLAETSTAAGLAEEPGLAPIVTAQSLKPLAAAVAADQRASGLMPPAVVAPSPEFKPAASLEERVADIERHRTSLIAALEGDIRDRRVASASDPELPRLEQELRLAYLLAGRLDDSVSAVESLDQPQREAYKDLMFGLGVWLSPDESRRAPLRSAKVLRSLRDAATDLAAASKLELRKLAFCEKVEYYGWYTEFPRAEFTPKQEVLLYVEVENFSAEHKSAAGFETELQGRYEILDGQGQIVAQRELPLDKEVCRNYRRDYFLVYHVYLPETIAPGRYRLELSLEDRKAGGKYQGRKFGEGTIEFTIR